MVTKSSAAWVAPLAAVLLAACSPSQTTPTETASLDPTSSAHSTTSDASASVTPVTTQSETPPRLTVGDVPGQPAAGNALRAWAADLAAGDMDVLVRKCWTIAPERVRGMYANRDAITAAIAEPGLDGQFAYVWQDANTRVSVQRSEIASGYACPYVSLKGDAHIFNAEDAKYRVLRFVQRIIGKPVNAADTEANYPLECSGWELTALTDTSRSIAKTTTSIDPNSLTASGGPDDWQVTVHGTSSGGESRDYLYRTSVGSEGYCIAAVQ